VREGECPINVGILLALDVTSEVVAWDDHVCREQYVDGIVDCCTTGNDRCIVGVEVGVEQLDVPLNGGAKGRLLPQVGAQGLDGGNRVDCGQGHDLLVEERCVYDIVDLVVPSER
jgi:hypothetical protein